ncbi:nuclear transport factor 2 family protein [Opitutaceae bacterium]
MTLVLPPIIAAFVVAKNAHDAAAFAACFAPDAVVHDEGREHRGVPAITAWFIEVTQKYRVTMTVTEMLVQRGERILAADIAGDFPGSPITLHYGLTIKRGPITALTIGD